MTAQPASCWSVFSRREGVAKRLLRLVAALSLLAGICACASHKAFDEYHTGVRLFKAEKFREAHEYAMAANIANPDEPAYMGLLGWTYLKQNNLSEAEKLFTRIYGRDRNSVLALQGLAWVDYSKNNYDSSEKWFKGQLVWAESLMSSWDFIYFSLPDRQYIHSIASDAYYGLGLIALARGKAEEATSYLSTALDYENEFIGPRPIRSALGDAYFQAKDYKNAEAAYRAILKDRKDNEVAAKLAWSVYYAGDIRGADRMFSESFAEAGDKRSSLYGLVFTRSALGKADEAKQALQDLIGLDAYYADTTAINELIIKNEPWKILWKNFASIYFERGDFAKAAEKLRVYIPVKKNDCDARIMAAWCTLYLTSLSDALEKFTQLRNESRCSGDQLETGRGVALFYLGRFEEADDALDKAHQLNAGNVRAAVARGAVAYGRGDYEAAIRIYNAHLSDFPTTELYFSWPSHALNNLGWSYIKTGRYRDALETFQRLKALHRNANSPQIFDGLGWSFLHLGQITEARSAFEAALRIDPGSKSALSGLSKARGGKN